MFDGSVRRLRTLECVSRKAEIVVSGAREHNLKDVTVSMPARTGARRAAGAEGEGVGGDEADVEPRLQPAAGEQRQADRTNGKIHQSTMKIQKV